MDPEDTKASVFDMMNRNNGLFARKSLPAFLAAAALLVATPALAKESSGVQPKAPGPPIPAEIEPLAAHALLLDVERVGGDYIAVGARGVILRSHDGIHWDQVHAPVQSVLTAVDFVNEQYGWAVGHAGTILATTDGGKTWHIQMWAAKKMIEFLDVYFFNKHKGFAIGTYGLFYKTHNGGETWTRYKSQLTKRGWHLTGIVELANGTLVVSGETGLLAKSTDGGQTWVLLDAPYSGSFFGITQLGPHGVLLYGLRGHAFLVEDISTVAPAPPDVNLMYDFKRPPTMETEAEKMKSKREQKSLAEKKGVHEKKAKAKAERKAIQKDIAGTNWQVVKTHSILSLFGATTTDKGGYVLVGRNGVIWLSHDHGGQVIHLPNPRTGSIADVVTTPGGDLVMVGRNGAFLYKRSATPDAE